MPVLPMREIFGQERAIAWLEQAYRADRLPHALIFAGPVGVGKGSVAAALGKLFLCDSPADAQPCDHCESCRLMDAGTHPDFHVIAKELIRYHDKTGKSKGIELSIQVLRPELLEPAGRKPSMNRGKVFVIEQAERMNAQAQNSILKTLEEPAGRALIILLTDQPDTLLPTIRSRCQVLRFAALDEARVGKQLQAWGIEARDAADAARLARGSLGLARKWIEDGVIAPARELTAMLDRVASGQPIDELPAWFKSVVDAYAARQLERDELASKDQATREGMTLYLLLGGEHVRRRLAAASSDAEREQACAAIDALVTAETLLDANVNTALTLAQLEIKLESRV